MYHYRRIRRPNYSLARSPEYRFESLSVHTLIFLTLFNDTCVNCTDYTSRGEKKQGYHECVRRNVSDSTTVCLEVTSYLGIYTRRDWERTRESSIRLADLPVEIRTGSSRIWVWSIIFAQTWKFDVISPLYNSLKRIINSNIFLTRE